MSNYKLINNILGWLMFLIASLVYILTSEPTTSFWDCGEYISTAYKLQVGHPPGAPFFQLMGRFFSLFAFGDTALVARMINTMSALCSGATIMFLFWTITALARKFRVKKEEQPDQTGTWAIFAAAIIGSLAYTFSDSFWFSAVEGEVYAMSSFFTAIAFWAILKWDAVADEQHSWRWIILIAFLMGLSIGVHLLNLLTIPAITFVYYYRKFRPSTKGFIVALIVSIGLLVVVMYGIIPQVVALFAQTELRFVNWLGLPFNSGTIFFMLLIIALIASSLWYTSTSKKGAAYLSLALAALLVIIVLMASDSVGSFLIRLLVMALFAVLVWFGRKKTAALKTAILSLAFILVGYSSFLILVIRSNAETPINENSPKDAISLLSYLNREQYGTWPLFYGQYYCAPLDTKEPYLDGNPVYGRDEKAGKYVVVDDRKAALPNYDDRFCTFFPRMWSSQQQIHESGYKSWAEVVGTPVEITNFRGQKDVIHKPTFGENLKFFFKYQLGHMYFRYFMWNFAGKQNDIQGYGGILNGNWISGIPFIDKARLGPQDDMPDYMASNKGRNTFFMLPLLLGLLGFIFTLNRDIKTWLIVFLLFVMTGIAINIYLNPVPYQPRARDYAYAASFYAFAIWIGFGVLWLYQLMKRWMKGWLSVAISFLLCLLCVPLIMAIEGWDDHDRSHRYTATAISANYLNTCAPNAILFTLGDNDTFPLWYAQEVEGIRTDVRVVNLSLLGTDWYIDQMRKKVYDSEPLPISLPREKYAGSRREITFIYEDSALVPPGAFVNLKELVAFATSDDKRLMLQTIRGYDNYFPTKNFSLDVDSARIRQEDWIPARYKDSVYSGLGFIYSDYAVQRNALIVLDLLSQFEWKRPVYFAITTGDDAYMGLQPYFRLEGLAYRLVPYYCESIDEMVGRVDTDIMYDNMMNKFSWGNMDRRGVYMDETNRRLMANIRNTFSRLAYALAYENKFDKAVKVCDRCLSVSPDYNMPWDKMLIPMADVYFRAGENDKALELSNKIMDRYEQEIYYFSRFSGADAAYLSGNLQEAADVIRTFGSMGQNYKQESLVKRASAILQSTGVPAQ